MVEIVFTLSSHWLFMTFSPKFGFGARLLSLGFATLNRNAPIYVTQDVYEISQHKEEKFLPFL